MALARATCAVFQLSLASSAAGPGIFSLAQLGARLLGGEEKAAVLFVHQTRH